MHKETGELHPRTVELLEQVALRVEQGGIEAWQTLDPRELLGDEADQYEKNRDTLDVWFDSGSTHATVLGGKDGAFAGSHGAELAWPADLYLEGSDQHRGWFHSSLLTGCMLYGQPPYKALLTHGFVVDGQGRKMSKSVGNVIAPQKVSDSLGAEILRLWVASTDYSGELSISDEILKRVVEGYRRIRNTLRFLLANLADFDAVSQAVPHGELFEIDRYALAMTAQMQAEISAHYERYDFHPAVSRLQTFCSEDLGAFYLDILKDRLYTTAAGSLARRSAQTALLEITQALLKLMAPILSFTAEEAWKELVASALKHQADAARVTIFTEVFHSLPPYADAEALTAKWTRLRAIRAEVQRKLEEVRTAGDIGSSLQAEVDLYAASADQELLASLGDDLRFVLIVSRATVHAGEGETRIEVTPSQHKSASAAGTGAWTWARTRTTPRSAAVACPTCSARVKPAARPEHGRPRRPQDAGPAVRPRRTGADRRLAGAGAVHHRPGPAHQDLLQHRVPVRRTAASAAVLRLHAGLQPRRGVQFPGDRGRLATLALHRPGLRGGGGHRLDAASHARPARFSLALALILGGAVGSVIDRVVYGHVVDFLLFYWNDWQFPAFNLADVGISCGAVLLVLDELLRSRKPRG